jgi:purine-binding chemotaxis protein CheW
MSKSNQYDAMVSYFNSLLTEPSSSTPIAKMQKLEEEHVETKPFVEEKDNRQLQQLLDKVETNQIVETKIKVEDKLTEKVEIKQKIAEPVVALSSKTIDKTHNEVSEQTKIENVTPSVAPWKNLQTDNEFSALFFKVAGVTLAVPLKNLGGIYEHGKITSIFGKPNWFSGIMTLHERKISVVDTVRWMMPTSDENIHSYKYVIMLDSSDWSLQCDELIGTKNLTRTGVKWRESAGARPWLAGIVKDEMCALIHVEELIGMLQRGIDVKDLVNKK